MNLDLIEEINTLKSNNISYTEIAEITGLARTSIVLSLRLSKIFNSAYEEQILSLNEDITFLKSSIIKYREKLLEKEVNIKKLNTFTDIDVNLNMLIKKSKFKSLEDELANRKKEIDSLRHELYIQDNYLYSLSFTDKMKILFQGY